MPWGKCAAGLAIIAGVCSSAALTATTASAGASDSCGRGWVYFDLGNTLVDTSDWNHLKYMEGARGYLLELKRAGFHLGLISNIPEAWGTTQEAKLARLEAEISKTWSEAQAFAWADFEDILLPPRDLDRKPAPYLYAQAMSLHSGCPIAFEGDDAIEVRAALIAGFTNGYVVGKNSPEGFFLPAERIFPQR